MGKSLNVSDFVDAIWEEAVRLSDAIWDAAEIAYNEHQSSALLSEALSKEGFGVEKGTGGIPTAFKASYGEGKPVVGLLAEYDALSGLSQKADRPAQEPIVHGGNGHGCGHNLLGAGCFAAAVALKRYLEEKKISGTIVLFGCPAEEGGSGKTFLARAGVFDGVDAAISWHPGDVTGVLPGSTLANVQMRYTFRGRSAHAAAAPHLGRSALDAVELMNVGANYLREHIIPEARVHYAITNTGGVSPNVVQSEAEVVYLIRAPQTEEAMAVRDRVNNIARGAALMTDTQVSIDFMKACSNFTANGILGQELTRALKMLGKPAFSEKDAAYCRSFRETFSPSKDMNGQMKRLFESVFPPEDRDSVLAAMNADINPLILPWVKQRITLPGSTDVADVSKVCPTAWFYAVTCAQGTQVHSWQMVAQGKSGVAHKGMLYAAKAMAITARNLFCDESLMASVKEEFARENRGKPYKCPIPPDVHPHDLVKNA